MSRPEENAIPPADGTGKCPFSHDDPTKAYLVMMPPKEQAKVIVALCQLVHGNLNENQLMAIVLSLAELERTAQKGSDVSKRPVKTRETTKDVDVAATKVGSVTIKAAHKKSVKVYSAVTEVNSVLRELWEHGATGKEILNKCIENAGFFDSFLSGVTLVPKGYKGEKDLVTPSKSCFQKDFIIWAIYTVFQVHTQDRLCDGDWKVPQLQTMWKAFNTTPRDSFLGHIHSMRRLRASPESSFNAEKYKIRMSWWIANQVYGDEYKVRWVMKADFSEVKKYLMDGSKYSQRVAKKDAFYGTAFHEIGHAVDYRFKITDTHAHLRQCGGWISLILSANVGVAIVEDFKARLVAAGVDEEYRQKIAEIDRDQRKFDAWKAKTPEERKAAQAAAVPIRSAYRKAQAAYAANKTEENKQAFEAAKVQWDTIEEPTQNNPNFDRDKAEAMAAAFKRKYGDDPSDFGGVLTRLIDGEELPQIINNAEKVALYERQPIVAIVRAQCRKVGGWDTSQAELQEKTTETGGRTWHKAYSTSWASFLVEAKTHGVTEYQFRAPGEWFADLYAFHFLEALEDHPMREWIAQCVNLREGSTVPTPPVIP